VTTFDSPTKQFFIMAYSTRLSYRPVSQNRMSTRSRQAFVLLAVIVIGMIISAAVNAIPSPKRTVATQVTTSELTTENQTN
jgi:hypothetical protein